MEALAVTKALGGGELGLGGALTVLRSSVSSAVGAVAAACVGRLSGGVGRLAATAGDGGWAAEVKGGAGRGVEFAAAWLSPRPFAVFLDAFCRLLVDSLMASLHGCTGLDEGAAGRLLLDAYGVKSAILQALDGEDVPGSAEEHVLAVNTRFRPLERTLRVLTAPVDEAVNVYMKEELEGASRGGFMKIIGMRRLRDAERHTLGDQYARACPTTPLCSHTPSEALSDAGVRRLAAYEALLLCGGVRRR